ncbi:LysR family transcriptional regulator [Rhodoferax sediminis]|uniref:LysR family transcriptional regulator n=1 Tax=Rhodoferax sediminis TaxID=2509614 RepID=A0A515D6X3_9BURK|nr:LysR family transcriptional regulator [Rhodoferax sediminis]QDL36154.1 LysR family transcriptional regulator [Rhodoferax sediminis]
MTGGVDYLVRRLRLRHLELLVALAETGSTRGAADRLHLSQPAISKMLNEIEGGFGARLFDRSHQGVQANAFGAAAVYRARVILSELARAQDEIDALRAGASAVLRVGAPSVTVTVPAAVVLLRARMPAASVQIREGRVSELIQRLLDGELDCVFGAVTPQLLSSDLLPLLQSELLLEDQLCVLAAASNVNVRRRGLRWADLRSAQWVAPPKETLVRQAFMTAFLNDGVEPPEPVIEAMSSVTVGALLRMDPSLLCAVRFEHARDEVARGNVRKVPVLPAIPLPSLGLFTRRAAIGQPAVVQEFARAIRKAGARAGPRAAPRSR